MQHVRFISVSYLGRWLWPSCAQNREQTYRGRRMHRTETDIRSANVKARGTNQGTEQLTGEITTGAGSTGAGLRGTTEGAAAAQGPPSTVEDAGCPSGFFPFLSLSRSVISRRCLFSRSNSHRASHSDSLIRRCGIFCDRMESIFSCSSAIFSIRPVSRTFLHSRC